MHAQAFDYGFSQRLSEGACCVLQKRGLAATGILAGMSKAAGFSSVSDLLQKNPEAKRPPIPSLDPSQPKVKHRSLSGRLPSVADRRD